jgi:hypothetical protein
MAERSFRIRFNPPPASIGMAKPKRDLTSAVPAQLGEARSGTGDIIWMHQLAHLTADHGIWMVSQS